ncbi:MAG: putative alpha/beta-hydrolase family hydrolase [Bradymonadia bacterium]|jgi:predicted alpha/beta-hydrolase family hydrolase
MFEDKAESESQPMPTTMPQLVLAFPATSGASADPLIEAVIEKWGDQGPTVHQVPLPPHETDATLLHLFEAGVANAGVAPEGLVIGGFSLGARIAALACRRLRPAGFVAMGFPFHRRGEPRAQHGFDALRDVEARSLVLQGTRDSHGNREHVMGLTLPATVEVHWLEDGNHRWVPRQRSWRTPSSLVEEAAETILAFVSESLLGAHDD